MNTSLSNFQGHIVLLTKNHYKHDSIFTALRRIWATRCGYEHIIGDNSSDRFIADELFVITKLVNQSETDLVVKQLHYELERSYRYKRLSPLETIIAFYISSICFCDVNKLVDGVYVPVLKLPTPLPDIFERIIQGTATYKDYEAIC